ncbi:MAG: hypothetical protein ACLP9L_38985 [Thermoguttaceae bacterium]
MSEALSMEPSGRSEKGTFAPGNKFSKGNPQAGKVQKLRSSLLQAVTVTDLRGVVKRLVDAAKGGDVSAAKLLFDRLLGLALALDIEQRLKTLEERLNDED